MGSRRKQNASWRPCGPNSLYANSARLVSASVRSLIVDMITCRNEMDPVSDNATKWIRSPQRLSRQSASHRTGTPQMPTVTETIGDLSAKKRPAANFELRGYDTSLQIDKHDVRK